MSCTYGPCYYDLGAPSTAGGKGACVFWGKPAYLRDAMDVTKKMQILDAARFASKYGNIEDLIVIEGTVSTEKVTVLRLGQLLNYETSTDLVILYIPLRTNK